MRGNNNTHWTVALIGLLHEGISSWQHLLRLGTLILVVVVACRVSSTPMREAFFVGAKIVIRSVT